MSRRGYSSTPRNYRGSSSRGNSSWNGTSHRGGYSGSSRYSGGSNSFHSPMESRSPYVSSKRYSGGERYSSGDRFSRSDDYHKSYRSEYSSMSRERRTPERKRMRVEAPSSRHDSYYGSSRHEPPSYSSERRFSNERPPPPPTISRREDFRRPSGPAPRRGSYRGRISSRGSRGLRGRDRMIRRRLVETSYGVRKRIIPRFSDYSRRLKISRMRSAIIARRNERPEIGETAKREPKPNDESQEKSDEAKRRSKGFIKLECPRCNMKALTFKKYEMHLHGRGHLMAMRRLALKQKAILGKMRHAQRNTQNELEKSSDDLGSRTNYCPLCKLNYKQKKAVHQLSEAHMNMKKFLMPYCNVCNITFKSPMVYETHCCSIEHLKCQQRMDTSDASAEEDNLENFTTIDSVGDVDGDGDGSDAEEKKEIENQPDDLGIEKIRQIEAYYCDLCKMYLQRGDETEIPKILTRHCKQRVHMTRYLRQQKIEKKEKELAEKAAKEGTETPAKKDDEQTKDDKLWADVDRDLGDILAEAETGNKSSDEDEDSHVNGERYDRFKLSEKNGDDKTMGNEEGIIDNKLIIKEDEKK